jgi:hypothetical protein
MSATKKMRIAAPAPAAPALAAPAAAAPETALTHITGAAALHMLLMCVWFADTAHAVFGWLPYTPFTREDVESRFKTMMEILDGLLVNEDALTVEDQHKMTLLFERSRNTVIVAKDVLFRELEQRMLYLVACVAQGKVPYE